MTTTPTRTKRPLTPRAIEYALYRQAQRNGYEITVEERDARLDAQKHTCAVCHRPFRTPTWHQNCTYAGKLTGRRVGTSPAVDHDHGNGRVRGLLCRYCNREVVTMVERHREAVERALKYVAEGGFSTK